MGRINTMRYENGTREPTERGWGWRESPKRKREQIRERSDAGRMVGHE